MSSTGLLDSVEDVDGEAVVNSSSSSDSMARFEAGVITEEARTPLLNEEETTGGVGEGRKENNCDGLHRNVGEDGEGTISFEDERNDPLDQADVAYGSDSFMAVVKPVALTMTLSAAITASLYADATGAQNSALSVYEVYDESSTLDPSSVRLGKSLVNAFIIVAAIAAVTVVIVVMYWMRCMKCLLGYMAISSVVLLGTLGGAVWATALEVFQIPCDVFTYYGVLWNFAVVGVIAIFYQKGIPTAVTQAYLVATSVIMAWHLSRFEEWTGWCLLVVLALYDLCAVLSPCGPLKALLHLMQEYDEPMPGLLYEAELPGALRRGRPSNEREAEAEAGQLRAEEEQAEGLRVTVSDEAQALIRHRTGAGYGHGDSQSEGFTVGNPSRGFSPVAHGSVFEAGGRAEGGARGSAGGIVRGSSVPDTPTSDGFVGFQGVEPQFLEDAGTRPKESDSGAPQAEGAVGRGHHDAPPSRPSTSRGFLTDRSALESRRGRGGGGDRERVAIAESLREDADGMVTMDGRDDRSAGAQDVNGMVMMDSRGAGARETGIRVRLPQSGREEAVEGNEGVTREATYERASIKLGLGDFIFYSVLVSKAALYSFTAWAASAVVIVFGLGTTLVLLAVYRMALPALPISIGLGTMFYLVTRLSMQPFVEALNEAPLYF